MAPAVHENDRPPDLNGREWHEALHAHAMNLILHLIHAKPRLLMCQYSKAQFVDEATIRYLICLKTIVF